MIIDTTNTVLECPECGDSLELLVLIPTAWYVHSGTMTEIPGDPREVDDTNEMWCDSCASRGPVSEFVKDGV